MAAKRLTAEDRRRGREKAALAPAPDESERARALVEKLAGAAESAGVSAEAVAIVWRCMEAGASARFAAGRCGLAVPVVRRVMARLAGYELSPRPVHGAGSSLSPERLL